jgi:apolipoprotein N-acyltransferase
VRRPGRPTLIRCGGAALTGVLCALSRPPVDLGPLAAIALVPLFVVWRDRGPRASAGYAFLAGVVYYTLLCSWIWYFGAIAIVPFVAACAGYWAAAAALIGWLRTRGLSNPFLTAAVWIVADTAVARFPFGGLSWGELGYAFHNVVSARAVASAGGVTLVTFLAVALNAFVADLLPHSRLPRHNAERRRMLHRSHARAYAGLLLIVVVVAAARITRPTPYVVKTLHVATVQGNDLNRDLTAAEEDARYLPNSHFALARQIRDPVDLIVFPESSMDADPRTDPYIHSQLAGFAREHHAWVLANATVDADPEGERALNLNVLFAPDGSLAGTYAKRHLVPFGEYVPFRKQLESWITEINKVPRDFARGDRPGLFDIDGVKVANLICFESAFGYQVRPLVHDGAEVLVVSTNNRSYRRSANSAQHLALSQMRAAETGRPVIQAAISGISAVIDANGNVHDRTHLFDRTLVDTTIEATTGQTLYVRWGEWAALACLVVVIVAVGFALFRRRSRSSVDSAPQDVMIDVADRIEGYELLDPEPTSSHE